MSPCRCLLKDTPETELLQNIREYISGLDEDIRTDDASYKKRLALCEKCDRLMNGMCLKCGCYVEMRAAVKSNRCPSEKKYW
ncbi:MAG: DUF6171 family protein [Bacteroides sp.]|nr:DUF6171 family protein [Bacteroides sp.]